ncbi:MAG: LysR family transcriptional regulator [Synergistaceae bacterium]|nr:LysR family transcriptional regulator [Synergistaceae bacterium]
MQQELEYIYAIYKAGSFSRAAENLYITQPALSMAVKKVEASIGMALFDRSTRPVSLTEAGKIYVDAVEKMLALEEDMTNQIHDIHELRAGSLCIGGSHYINAYILPEAMATFSAEYPGIRLELVEASSAELAEMLEERLIDLTFSCREDIINNFEHIPAFKDHILLAVSPLRMNLPCALSAEDVIEGKHLQADCPAIPAEAMNGLEYVILSEGNNLHDRALTIFQEAGITPRIKLEIAQLATSYHLAGANFGAAFISDRMIQRGDDGLRFYRIDSDVTERAFYGVLPRREYTSKAVRAFIGVFSSVLQPSPQDASRAREPSADPQEKPSPCILLCPAR